MSRAITLVESTHPRSSCPADELLEILYPKSGQALRVGITGVPGVGKSTFIEALGSRLCDGGRKLAVLTVDPSSELTGGSILGDKTRMENLARIQTPSSAPAPRAVFWAAWRAGRGRR